MRPLALSAAICTLAVTTAARADDSVRCGEWLVRAGASMGEVRHKCGDPSETYTATEYDDRTGRSTIIDRWLYNRGPNEFIRTLTFRAGSLTYVTAGDRGY